MAPNPFSVSLPIAQVPLTDANGRITQPWLYWLLTIQNRTGGVPGIPIAPISGNVGALAVEQAMADQTFPAPPAALAILMDQALADNVAPPAPVAFPVLLGQAMADDVPRPGINPFIVALMVCD